VVYLVKVQTQLMVAKVYRPSSDKEFENANSFLMGKEIKALHELNGSTNIVRLNGVCTDPEMTCILMEYMERGSLRQVSRFSTCLAFTLHHLTPLMLALATGSRHGDTAYLADL
jgi:serine/threonine protein kinase